MAAAAAGMGGAARAAAEPASGAEVALKVRAAKPARTFEPDLSLGTSVDILDHADIQRLYTSDAIKTCLSAGYGITSYRLHTPETVDYWHWNPRGRWSDPVRQEGYFTGDAEPVEMIRDSYGFELEHRGVTHQKRHRNGYSRLTDGNPESYWKSNPYLTSHFTGEDDRLHPQWIVVDLGRYNPVDAIRIDWAEPSAREFQIEYWVGDDPMDWEEPSMDLIGEGGDYLPVSRQAEGRWIQFPHGVVQDGRGGRTTLKLTEEPVNTRYVRVVMTQSSNRALPNAGDDLRARSGYAIHEVHVGRMESGGGFADLVNHTVGQNQTATYCSSTDPWHSAKSRNPKGDQTGLDLFCSSGITNHLPAMIPVGIIYSIPEDAAAQIAYLKKRGYSLGWIEMGEEADGQYCMPEDYAALYIQFADAIHKVDPGLKLGGPVFRGIRQDVSVWPDAQGRTSWFGRFLDYLKAHGHLQDLAFVSFEIYPFNSQTMDWDDLFRVPELSRQRLQTFWQDGLPQHIPLVNSESNLCGSLCRWMSDIFSALWLADSVANFFLNGGGIYIHSPMDPGGTQEGGQGWGNWANFSWGPNNTVVDYMPFYWGSRLINLEWLQHRAGANRLYTVDGGLEDEHGHVLVSAYAAQRPDGDWALLLVNRDRERSHTVTVSFREETGSRYFSGPVRMVTYGSEQYVWHGEPSLTREQAHADPHEPPRESTIEAGQGTPVRLPKSSVTVLRGQITK